MNNSTNYLNAKGRRIVMTKRGSFAVKKADGSLYYGPKAKFLKKGDSNKIALNTNMTNNVPLAIRPARVGAPPGPRPGKLQRQMNKNSTLTSKMRKVRSNKGVKRGPRMTEAKAFGMIFNNAPAPGPKVRKLRVNKGVKRGPRMTEARAFNMVFGTPAPVRAPARRGRPAKPVMPNNGGDAFRKIFAERKPRGNKGTKREPRIPKSRNPFDVLRNL